MQDNAHDDVAIHIYSAAALVIVIVIVIVIGKKRVVGLAWCWVSFLISNFNFTFG
jgi:hypothetical protein